ncbi:MAG: HDOD domain-containing protein [Spirochaetota bacterium]|nr:HDOD domain-containing protein [Spirochaetota bacterium]
MTKQEILKKILNEIDNIPPIPANIIKVKQLINNPNSSISNISVYVKRDPALTADLLRIANSAWYMTRTKVGTVERAITTIGLSQLETLILTIGAKKVLSERYMAMEEIWEHSYKCAFYSQFLAKMKNLRDELENAYTAGLLHDIGKLILLSLTPHLVERITNLGSSQNIPIHEIERLALGISHAQIGERVAAHWNFPSKLAVAIGHHHEPRLTKEEWIPLTYTTYLSNILCKVTAGNIPVLALIDAKVLEYFGIDSEKKLETINNTLEEFYRTVGEVQKTA